MRVHLARSRFALSDAGAIMVRMDMRYMWSEMLSQWLMPKRRQPARLVVLRRSSRWKKGTGEAVDSA
jgi:hypothetical protein